MSAAGTRSRFYDPIAIGSGTAARYLEQPWRAIAGRGIKPGHPAFREARSIYTGSVVHPAASPRVLVSGINQRKIGARMEKGPWRGSAIYCLTLEERATCPRSCHNWEACMGNSIPYARRHQHGPALTAALARELPALHARHRRGIAVRLHVLGDFYSTDYVDFWGEQLHCLPRLRVFGFTAHRLGTGIGDAIDWLNRLYPGQAAIRFSDTAPGPNRAITIDRPELVPVGATICPVQTGKAGGCGSCGLCFAAGFEGRAVAFLRHGRAVRK